MLSTKAYLTQAAVQKILDAADQHAAKNHWAVTIAVCDDGGHIVGLIRRDGCAPLSAYIAQTCFGKIQSFAWHWPRQN